MDRRRRRLAVAAALLGPGSFGCSRVGPAPPAPASGLPEAAAPTPIRGAPPERLTFPLQVGPARRHLVDARGRPVLLFGDTPWSIAVQLTHAQIDVYLTDRAAKGFNAILFQPMEHLFSSQTPPWRNAESGAEPFVSTGSDRVSWALRVEPYWRTVDHIVNRAKELGIVCFMTPAYLGYAGGIGAPGDQGWNGAVLNASAAELHNYGAFLAARYSQGNVVWVMGGDYAGSLAERDKQWDIATGIRSVRTTDIITGHPMRADEEAYPYWSRYAGFNLNSIYTNGVEHDIAARAYRRAGPVPFFFIEGKYEGDGARDADIRRQAYVSVLSGACGHFFGNTPLWGFGEPHANGGGGAAAALAVALDTPATRQMKYFRDFFAQLPWWTLRPGAEGELVKSPLGEKSDRVSYAISSDATVAVVWKPHAGSITVDLGALRAPRIRLRFYDTTTGTFSDAPAAPLVGGGVHRIEWPGERIALFESA